MCAVLPCHACPSVLVSWRLRYQLKHSETLRTAFLGPWKGWGLRDNIASLHLCLLFAYKFDIRFLYVLFRATCPYCEPLPASESRIILGSTGACLLHPSVCSHCGVQCMLCMMPGAELGRDSTKVTSQLLVQPTSDHLHLGLVTYLSWPQRMSSGAVMGTEWVDVMMALHVYLPSLEETVSTYMLVMIRWLLDLYDQ